MVHYTDTFSGYTTGQHWTSILSLPTNLLRVCTTLFVSVGGSHYILQKWRTFWLSGTVASRMQVTIQMTLYISVSVQSLCLDLTCEQFIVTLQSGSGPMLFKLVLTFLSMRRTTI